MQQKRAGEAGAGARDVAETDAAPAVATPVAVAGNTVDEVALVVAGGQLAGVDELEILDERHEDEAWMMMAPSACLSVAAEVAAASMEQVEAG